MSTCDLNGLYGELALSVPDELGSAKMIFSRDTFREPPRVLRTDRLVLTKGSHEYDSYLRVDGLHASASKSTYRQLGLLIANVVFWHELTEVRIELHHAASDIRRLVVRPGVATGPGYQSRPYRFDYYPREVDRADCRRDPSSWPAFWLSNEAELVTRDNEWAARDTVFGFGSDASNMRLAAMLLDLGRASSTVDEIPLESTAGFGGVHPLSAEITFWLPGSIGYDDQLG